MVYNVCYDDESKIYEDCSNVLGIEFSKEDKTLISNFEKLEFKEKLDVFGELIIRYNNKTYFKEDLAVVTFDSELSWFDRSKLICDYKKKL